MTPILKTAYIEKFKCLGPECPDICCTKFTVAVDEPTYQKYVTQAPELLDFVTEKPSVGKALKFDAATGNCPKLSCGTCTIHANYGTEFLTDTCHLYPRITRGIGEQLTMAGALSCPEVARLTLFDESNTHFVPATTDRVPYVLNSYLPADWNKDAALGLHARFISLAEQSQTAELFLIKLMYFAKRFGEAPYSEWETHLDASWRVMDVLLPKGKPDARDSFFMMIIFSTLLTATKHTPNARLQHILDAMQAALACSMDVESAAVNTTEKSMSQAEVLSQYWKQNAALPLENIMKRIVSAKMSSSLFPFAGLGANLEQKVLWLALQYALIKLALSAIAYNKSGLPSEAETVQAVQTITRVLDHLTTLDFFLPMLQETGWLELDRLNGLLQA